MEVLDETRLKLSPNPIMNCMERSPVRAVGLIGFSRYCSFAAIVCLSMLGCACKIPSNGSLRFVVFAPEEVAVPSNGKIAIPIALQNITGQKLCIRFQQGSPYQLPQQGWLWFSDNKAQDPTHPAPIFDIDTYVATLYFLDIQLKPNETFRRPQDFYLQVGLRSGAKPGASGVFNLIINLSPWVTISDYQSAQVTIPIRVTVGSAGASPIVGGETAHYSILVHNRVRELPRTGLRAVRYKKTGRKENLVPLLFFELALFSQKSDKKPAAPNQP
jgi:hypothetical protein